MASTQVPDLVRDSQLRARFSEKLTYHDRGGREEEWRRKRSLGAGGFGRVFLEECNSHGDSKQCDLRAVKIIPKESSFGPIDYNSELLAIAKFSQPTFNSYFIRSFGWYQNDEHVSITMEYMEHGDLGNYLMQPLPENETQLIVRQLLHGLGYMHDNNFTHRDLKPKNVFVVTNGPDWWVKIGDFGLSKRVHESTALRSFVGTRGYVAPEVYQAMGKSKDEKNCAYTSAADMWSLGILVWRTLSGKRPSSQDIKYLTATSSTKSVGGTVFLSGLSEQAYLFLKVLLKEDPCHRLTARNGLQHAWLKECTRETHGPSSVGTWQASADFPPSLSASSSHELSEASGRLSNLDESDSEPISSTEATTGQAVTLPSKAASFKAVRLCFADSPPSRSSLNSDEFPGAPRRLSYIQEMISNSSWTIRTKGSSEQPFEPSYQVVRNTISEPPRLPPDLYPAVLADDYFYKRGCSFLDEKSHVLAETAFKQFLNMQTQSLRHTSNGGEATFDIDTSMALYKLGHCVLAQGRYDEAEGFLREAAEQQKELLGHYDEDTLMSIFWYGRSFFAQGKLLEAEEAFQQAVKGKERISGFEDESTLFYMSWLGICLKAQEKYSDAEKIFCRVATGREKVLGYNDPKTLDSVNRLARTLYLQEKYGEAERGYRQLSERQIEVLGPGNRATLCSLFWLGHSLRHQGKYDEVKETLLGLVGAETELGSSHGDTLDTILQLANTLILPKNYDKAERGSRYFGEKQTEALGAENSTTFSSLFWLGRSLRQQGKYNEAEETLREVMEARETELGPYHKGTLDCMHELALTQYIPGKYDTAASTFNRLAEIQGESLGAKKRETLTAAHWAGRCFYYHGNYAEAIKIFDRVHLAQRETLGGDHGDTKFARHWLRKSRRKGAKGVFTNLVGSFF